MTIQELNLYINSYSEKSKIEKKNNVINAYYNAYFYAKSQSKGGLSNSDLTKILNHIDGKDGKMTDEEMFEVMKTML